jgi:mono/diheme cytochrome c family protein
VAAVTGAPAFTTRAIAQSANDGVYSSAQAKRGKTGYDQHCASCHSPDLTGSPVYGYPPLAGDVFMSHWKDRTVGDLLTLIRTTMPQNKPDSLEPAVYLDIVAYLLESNDFPSGTRDLEGDAESLKTVSMRTAR